MHWDWHWASALGEAARVLPVLACALLLLARQSPAGRIAARRWLTATGATSVLVAASKIAFYGWGTGVKAWNLAMPSGHAALALALWPVLLTVLVPTERRTWRHLATAAGIAMGLACTWSRVALRAHPLAEAVAGSMIGLAAMAMTLPSMQAVRLTIPRGALAGALLLALLLWTAPYPRRLPTETWFARAGASLAGRPTPIARKDWREPKARPPHPRATMPPPPARNGR